MNPKKWPRTPALAAAVLCIVLLTAACGTKIGVIPPGGAASEIVQTAPGTEAQTQSAEQVQAERRRLDEARQALLDDAALLFRGYYYDEAIEKLESAGELKNGDTETKAAEYRAGKAALSEYTGQIYHVFFHTLLIYPELAFTGDAMSEGYNMWMTTRDEFVKMLPLFFKGGYVLYDIEALFEKHPDGTVSQKKIMLPESKKPLVISIDDVCYYEYMKNDGFADRLTVNGKGDVVTVVRSPEGTVSETYDGDVMPIVDEFVKAHPEFSYRGAKGVVAVTGYQGIYGYRITDLEGEELEKARRDARAVSDALRAAGWKIANHSYTHNSFFRDKKLDMEQLTYDIERWKAYIEPFTGDVDIFISPFGVTLNSDPEAFRYIIDQGYTVYCPVGAPMKTWFNEDHMVQERLNLDGYTMMKHPERVSKHFFDPAEVLDPRRPPLG